MKTYQPHIHDFGYKLGATDEFREALKSLGFKFVAPTVNRGCHWGMVYFFNEDLELAKSLIDPSDKHFRIDTETRYFYVSPYRADPDSSHWGFSISSNKPRVYKSVTRKKRGPYHKKGK
jgi:hypothetical protein